VGKNGKITVTYYKQHRGSIHIFLRGRERHAIRVITILECGELQSISWSTMNDTVPQCIWRNEKLFVYEKIWQ
jgi:hypothetical protein